ncbi:MAG: hypothetical protein HZA70_02660, partial [Planctomycetes bacterium]|nr:hypothetical protein [Planctomycetota bacterium]
MEKEGLRNIPSVHELVEIVACDLASHECSEGSASVSDKLTRYTYPRGLVVSTVREVLEDLRGALKRNESEVDLSPDAIVSMIKARLMSKTRLSLQRVINATGVI